MRWLVVIFGLALGACSMVTEEFDNHCISKQPVKCALSLGLVRYTYHMPP